MIEINLVPLHLRKKKKKSLLPGGINIPIEVVIGIGGGVFALLILAHVLLLFTNIAKLAQHKRLQKQWEEIAPDKAKVDAVVNEMRELQSRYKSIEEITGVDKILWSQKLNILSDNLPRGVWLTKIVLNDEMLLIEGSATSKQRQEMINVHNLASNLKSNEAFLEDLEDLELGSIQRRRVQKIEIADFLITTKLK